MTAKGWRKRQTGEHMSIEAMKQALEALEFDTPEDNWFGYGCKEDEAITFLRQAIAEAEKQEVERQLDAHAKELRETYLTPQRQWVSLTDEEMLSVVHYTQLDNARAIEAKLKEKNT